MKSIGETLALLALASALACGNESAPATPMPTSGAAAASLVTPNVDDGAILVSLTGPGITSVQSASSAYFAQSRVVSASEVRLVVVGDLSAGVVATVVVPDVRRIGEYSGSVLEVASRGDQVRNSVAGYAIHLAVSQ